VIVVEGHNRAPTKSARSDLNVNRNLGALNISSLHLVLVHCRKEGACRREIQGVSNGTTKAKVGLMVIRGTVGARIGKRLIRAAAKS
jgi:hypothetical protein